MTTALDTKLRPIVTSIIAKFGTALIFNVPETFVYNPTTGISTKTNITAHTVKGSPPAPYDTRYVDGETIQAQDCASYIAAEDIESAGFTMDLGKGITVTFDSVDWGVISIRRHRSGDQVAAYELQLRR